MSLESWMLGQKKVVRRKGYPMDAVLKGVLIGLLLAVAIFMVMAAV